MFGLVFVGIKKAARAESNIGVEVTNAVVDQRRNKARDSVHKDER